MIYNVIKRIISTGNYNKEDMSTKLEIYLLYNSITDAQYKELMELMA